MTEHLAEMDAFELRWQLVHGLHPSDGLIAFVVDARTILVVGTDNTPHPKHGVYMATGRMLRLSLSFSRPEYWSSAREANGVSHSHKPMSVLADLDDDLAWVRRRSDT